MNNKVNTVFLINGSTDGHIVEGCGTSVVGSMLRQYPLVRRGSVNIIVLKGFMVNNQFVAFKTEDYAKPHR